MSALEHTFAITGMHCPSCGMLIDDALEQVPGVLTAHTDVTAARTTARVSGPQVAVGVLLATITAEGYGAVHTGQTPAP